MLIVSVWLNQTVTMWIVMMDFEWNWEFFWAHSLSFEIYIQFLIRSVWQKYLKIRALILFRNKGWKRPWNRENCCRWNWCCPPDIDALHWYWCRWTDADTLMLLFYCLLLWTRTHLPLQRKTCKVALLCATHLWKSTSEMHNVQIAQWIFSPTFIHFQPLSSALVCFRSPKMLLNTQSMSVGIEISEC